MYMRTLLLTVAAGAVPALATVPSLNVPACPSKGTIQYSKSVPNLTAFPLTQVDLCYDNQAIRINFTAFQETNFYYNSSLKTNDPIYEYEVMEAFIYKGTNDPKTYLEFEVAPNNVTFNAFIYNPSKVRATGAPFDTFFIQTPVFDGLTAKTTLNKPKKTWVSSVRVPLGLFDVDDGQAKGTQWRMNFFRTVVDPKTFPKQLLGAWSPPDAPSFHKTPFFGNINFV
ncbi:MAG: hypothetical protein MMC23_007613 [Stictis urceolatum]|nr:hypothetical protein [Stictis urceolata]